MQNALQIQSIINQHFKLQKKHLRSPQHRHTHTVDINADMDTHKHPKKQLHHKIPTFANVKIQHLIPCNTKKQSPATRNRTREHLIAAEVYSQMLYQLSYSRIQNQEAKCH